MGEPLPEVLDWPENARRANLNMGYIKFIPDTPGKSSPAVAANITQAEKAPRPTPAPVDALAEELGLAPPVKERSKKKRR